MPSFLENGATWLAGQLTNTTVAGIECVYRRGDEVFDVSLCRSRLDDARDRNWLLHDKELSARSSQWVAKRTDLLLGLVQITPQPGDEISWTDDADEPRTDVVFPLVAEYCFRFADPAKRILRLYTVDSQSLSDIVFRVAGTEFTLRGLVTRIAGRQFTTDLANTVKVSQANAYFARADLVAKGVTSIPNWASITAHDSIWAVNMSESEWGAERVKLALEKEELEREYQARRTAQR
jgi:hypothetical protein